MYRRYLATVIFSDLVNLSVTAPDLNLGVEVEWVVLVKVFTSYHLIYILLQYAYDVTIIR